MARVKQWLAMLESGKVDVLLVSEVVHLDYPDKVPRYQSGFVWKAEGR